MSSVNPAIYDQGITLRQAALIAGLGILMTVFSAPFVEFVVFPNLVIQGNIEETAQNFVGRQWLFRAGIFAQIITYVGDLLAAWALFVLLTPVNRSLAALVGWFRLVYVVIAAGSVANFVTVSHLLTTPDYVAALGWDQLNAQVQVLLKLSGHGWRTGMVFMTLHLALLGYLVYKSGYIPKILGVLLTIAGLGYLIYVLGPYLFPNTGFEFLIITFFGELIFVFWLLVRGWKIQEPTAHS